MPGAPGEVVVDAPQLMTRYLNHPDATAAVIRNGWLHTRDMGMCDEHGFVHLLGRTDEMIISGGFNIAPREVERAVEAVPAVAECVVVGRVDERWGERVTAVVTSKGGAEVTESGLISATKERLGFRDAEAGRGGRGNSEERLREGRSRRPPGAARRARGARRPRSDSDRRSMR